MVPETSENSMAEINRIKAEAENLEPFEYPPGVIVKIEPTFALADQKVRGYFISKQFKNL